MRALCIAVVLVVSGGGCACSDPASPVDAGGGAASDVPIDAPASRFEIVLEPEGPTPCDPWVVPAPVEPIGVPLPAGTEPRVLWSWNPYSDPLITGAFWPHVLPHATRLYGVSPEGYLLVSAPDARTLVQLGRDGRARWIRQLAMLSDAQVNDAVALPDGRTFLYLDQDLWLLRPDGIPTGIRTPVPAGGAMNFAFDAFGHAFYRRQGILVATCAEGPEVWRASVDVVGGDAPMSAGEIVRFVVLEDGAVVASVRGSDALLRVEPGAHDARWLAASPPVPDWRLVDLRGVGPSALLVEQLVSEEAWGSAGSTSRIVLSDREGATRWAGVVWPSIALARSLLTPDDGVLTLSSGPDGAAATMTRLRPPAELWERTGANCFRESVVVTDDGGVMCVDRAGALVRLASTTGEDVWRYAPRTDLRPTEAAEARLILDVDGIAYMVVYPAEAASIYGSEGWVIALQTDSRPAIGNFCLDARHCTPSGSASVAR